MTIHTDEDVRLTINAKGKKKVTEKNKTRIKIGILAFIL